MKCREVINHCEAYKDRELDPQMALEVEQHLATCQECAREFAEQRSADSIIISTLKGGGKTEALWRAVEARIQERAGESRFVAAPDRVAEPVRSGLREKLESMGRNLYASLLPSPRAWSALAAVWIVILALNLAARDEANYSETTTQTPSVSQVRFALEQKQILTAELGLPAQPADKLSHEQRSPRSELSTQNRNA
jgi:anti-sigma factor RsiW